MDPGEKERSRPGPSGSPRVLREDDVVPIEDELVLIEDHVVLFEHQVVPIEDEVVLIEDEVVLTRDERAARRCESCDSRLVPVARPSLASLEALLDGLDPSRPTSLEHALSIAREGLGSSVSTRDARYFGLPHATPSEASVAVDALVSEHNPELAVLAHAPFAVLAEARAASWVASRLGLAGASGVFTSGGAESNLSGLLVALSRDPAWRAGGVRALAKAPRVYVSREGHPSMTRAARAAGLGEDNVVGVAVDARGAMRTEALRDAVGKDVARGLSPLAVVATLGTTGTGAFDPLPDLADVAARVGASLHVDAALGGMLAYSSRRHALAGLDRADTVAFDPHKGLFCPLGTGLFFARDAGALLRAFSVDASYLPRDEPRDPVQRGLAWSRRANGLRVWLTLATWGDAGVVERVDRMLALADRLADGLQAAGLVVTSRSSLPVVGFVGPGPDGALASRLADAQARVAEAAGARLALLRSPSGARYLRAAVSSPHTTEADVDALVAALSAVLRQ